MKNLFFVFALSMLAACTHTEEENYAMADKIIVRMAAINDSLVYFDSALSASYPVAKAQLQQKKGGLQYSKLFIDSVKRTRDSQYAKLMGRHNVLQEQHSTYKEMFLLVHKRLPRDSAEKNNQLMSAYQKMIR